MLSEAQLASQPCPGVIGTIFSPVLVRLEPLAGQPATPATDRRPVAAVRARCTDRRRNASPAAHGFGRCLQPAAAQELDSGGCADLRRRRRWWRDDEVLVEASLQWTAVLGDERRLGL